jgi:hypothetical protein
MRLTKTNYLVEPRAIREHRSRTLKDEVIKCGASEPLGKFAGRPSRSE